MIKALYALANSMPNLRLPPLFPMTKVAESEDEAVYEAQVSGLALLVFWWLSDDQNEMHDPASSKGMVQGLVFMTLLNAAISQWLPGKKAQKICCEVRMPCYVRLEDQRRITVRLSARADGTIAVTLEAVVRQSSNRPVLLMEAVVTLYSKT